MLTSTLLHTPTVPAALSQNKRQVYLGPSLIACKQQTRGQQEQVLFWGCFLR